MPIQFPNKNDANPNIHEFTPTMDIPLSKDGSKIISENEPATIQLKTGNRGYPELQLKQPPEPIEGFQVVDNTVIRDLDELTPFPLLDSKLVSS
jgi:hypothetical protein